MCVNNNEQTIFDNKDSKLFIRTNISSLTGCREATSLYRNPREKTHWNDFNTLISELTAAKHNLEVDTFHLKYWKISYNFS